MYFSFFFQLTVIPCHGRAATVTKHAKPELHAGDLALRELPSPGKSGSMFFLSHDDRYMIKTMRKVRL